jgi:hypothetical protein
MLPLFFYLLKVILVSGILSGYYWISLRNTKFHYYNRFYLMGSLLLSLALPLLNLQWFSFAPAPTSPVHQVAQLIYFTPNSGVASSILEWDQLLAIGCSLISGILVLLFLIGISKLYLIKSKGRVTPMEQFDFIETSLEEAPFSFFRNLFWKKEVPLHDQAGQRMLQHELAHIQQFHSLDKVIVTLSTCIFWMNPFFWLIRKELEVVHEFIADEEAIAGNDATLLAEMLLTAHYPSNIFSNGQSFFYSSIKRRIIMLTSSNKTSYSYARRLLVLPLSIGVMALLSFTIKNNSPEKLQINMTSPDKWIEHLDTIPAQFRDASTGKLIGNFQVEIQGDTAIFKDRKSKKDLFSVPLNQLGVMAGPNKTGDGNNSVTNKKVIFITADSSMIYGTGLTITKVAKGTLIKEKKNPRIIVNGVELSSTDAINSIPPASIKTIDMRGGEMNIKVDSTDASFTYAEPKGGSGETVYKIIAGIVQSDTFAIEDLTLEKAIPDVRLESNSKKDEETITVTTKKVDGNLVYTITKKLTFESPLPADVLCLIDGKESDAATVKALNPNSIKSINVLKGNSTSKYGEKGKNGVIEIITKK